MIQIIMASTDDEGDLTHNISVKETNRLGWIQTEHILHAFKLYSYELNHRLCNDMQVFIAYFCNDISKLLCTD